MDEESSRLLTLKLYYEILNKMGDTKREVLMFIMRLDLDFQNSLHSFNVMSFLLEEGKLQKANEVETHALCLEGWLLLTDHLILSSFCMWFLYELLLVRESLYYIMEPSWYIHPSAILTVLLD